MGFQDNDHVDVPGENEMGMADYVVADGNSIKDYYLNTDENEEPDLDASQDGRVPSRDIARPPFV